MIEFVSGGIKRKGVIIRKFTMSNGKIYYEVEVAKEMATFKGEKVFLSEGEINNACSVE